MLFNKVIFSSNDFSLDTEGYGIMDASGEPEHILYVERVWTVDVIPGVYRLLLTLIRYMIVDGSKLWCVLNQYSIME